ncbi:LysR family transcriptional regulator [Blastococcus sp. URHD0036]|uniref:LysR family transcriptional regulator n=1 Tax=Blastococcus sp. URHD0036 TaxID=1380356 RepID=UPI00068DF9F7|nr:LysR family transcriptional regulator [Blastococcus sp. URHD0036]
MNLQQLRYVVATADAGTMTGAAAACHVAQPALSRAVRALERELGLSLFRRDGRRVAITDEGRAVVAAARRALGEVALIEGLAGRVARQTTVTVAATPTIQADLGSGLLGEFRQRYPHFPVRLLHCPSAEAVGEAVADGRADAGVCDLPVSGDLVELPFETREVVLIAPPGADLPDPVPMASVAALPLIVPTRGDRRRGIEAMVAGAGVELRVGFESDERSSWIPAVLAGFGGCLWYRAQGAEAAALGARVMGLDPPMRLSIGVVHREEHLAPPVAGLVRLARERTSPPE